MEISAKDKDMDTENTYRTVLRRTFLTGGLPGDLKPADPHLQIFDNHLKGTRIRLRRIRVPETKQWTRVLEQFWPSADGGPGRHSISQMFLDEAEYAALSHLEGREIRKNRYFFETDGMRGEADVFLGKLWGLNLVHIRFKDEAAMSELETPGFAVAEVTGDGFFSGDNLVEMEFEDIRQWLSRRSADVPSAR